MNNQEKRAFLCEFMSQVQQKILSRANGWPVNWDGHELRELVADAFDDERTRLLKEDIKRRRNYRNECLLNDLY